MPAGKDLIKQVEGRLDLEIGKTVPQINGALAVPCSRRAIRYAVTKLIADGKARRAGNQIFKLAEAV